MWWITLTFVGFFLGSMPFSLILGKLFLKTDVRLYGDGNPGSANAFRAGGLRLGLASGLLDFMKGALPVGLARFFMGVDGWRILPVAAAPLLGSAFSPFLRFRGGKSIAVTFGVWTGLLMFEGPLALGISLALFTAALSSDAWSAVLGLTTFVVYLIARRSEPAILAVWAVNTFLVTWKHARDLKRPLCLRPYLRRPHRRPAGGL